MCADEKFDNPTTSGFRTPVEFTSLQLPEIVVLREQRDRRAPPRPIALETVDPSRTPTPALPYRIRAEWRSLPAPSESEGGPTVRSIPFCLLATRLSRAHSKIASPVYGVPNPLPRVGVVDGGVPGAVFRDGLPDRYTFDLHTPQLVANKRPASAQIATLSLSLHSPFRYSRRTYGER